MGVNAALLPSGPLWGQEEAVNFDDAISAHVQWKVRLRVHISEGGEAKLDSDEIEHDDRCDLGRWIHGEGTRYEADDAYAKLLDEHRMFHRVAAAVVRHANAGNRAAALNLLDVEFTKHSFAVIAAINNIKHHHEQAARPA